MNNRNNNGSNDFGPELGLLFALIAWHHPRLVLRPLYVILFICGIDQAFGWQILGITQTGLSTWFVFLLSVITFVCTEFGNF